MLGTVTIAGIEFQVESWIVEPADVISPEDLKAEIVATPAQGISND